MGPLSNGPLSWQHIQLFTLAHLNGFNMKCDIKEGTFVNKKNKDFADFLIKCGVPAAEANKMLEKGMTTKVEVSKVGDKKWRAMITCKEFPAMNEMHDYEEDKETCIDDNVFGGTVKILTNCPSKDTLTFSIDHSKMGKSDVCDVYSDEGITITTKHGSGATITEKWDRVCCEEGAYRYVCNENGEEFAKATGDLEGSDMTFEDAMKGASFMLKDLGNDCWQMTEQFIGQTVSFKITMNEEIDYNFSGWERKMFCTRISPNKLKCIMKKKDGSVQEWMRCQMANGNMVWHGSCPKTGKEVKIYYEKFTCLDGTWKPVCIEGAEEMAKAMGSPDKMAKDGANDYDQKVCVKTKPGGYWHVSSDSKVFPYNITYKLGEEFEWDMSHIPGMPEGMDLKMKCMETCVGKDSYIMICKYATGTVKSVTKCTPNFMVKKDYILGSNISSTVIFMRC